MKLNENAEFSKYLDYLKSAIDEETNAVNLYEDLLKLSLPASVKKIIKEISDDEKDHLVLISTLFDDEISEKFKGYGDMEIEEG